MHKSHSFYKNAIIFMPTADNLVNHFIYHEHLSLVMDLFLFHFWHLHSIPAWEFIIIYIPSSPSVISAVFIFLFFNFRDRWSKRSLPYTSVSFQRRFLVMKALRQRVGTVLRLVTLLRRLLSRKTQQCVSVPICSYNCPSTGNLCFFKSLSIWQVKEGHNYCFLKKH